MNTITANELMINEPVSAKAKTIYQYLAFRSNREHRCFPALKTIAKECSMSVSTIQRALRELLDGGYIRKAHNYRPNGSQTSNIYEMIVTVAGRARAAEENLQQRLKEVRKKLEQINQNTQQFVLDLPKAPLADDQKMTRQKLKW